MKVIRTVTEPFYFLFKGILASPTAGGFTLALPIIIAIGAYVLLTSPSRDCCG